MKNLFFAKDRVAARNYLKRASLHEGKKINLASLKLSSKQIKHINGWKTWQFSWK